MKKIIGIAMSIVMAFACLALTACGADESYKFSKMSINAYGMETTINAGDTSDNAMIQQMFGEEALNEDFMTLTLKKDGTCELTSAMENPAEGEETEEPTTTTTWEKKDGKVIITMTAQIEGEEVSETIEFVEEDGFLVYQMSMSGITVKIYLAKK